MNLKDLRQLHVAFLITNKQITLLSGHFRPYDYGALKNLVFYGRFVPPEYPVERITAPVILYNGINDYLAHPKVIKLHLTIFTILR